MKLVIFTNATYEEEMALVDVDNEVVILQGDYCHDKIECVIDGYLSALSDHGIYSRMAVSSEDIGPDNSWFDKCNFYNNGMDDDEEEEYEDYDPEDFEDEEEDGD